MARRSPIDGASITGARLGQDPFLAADVTSAPSPPRQLIGERYLIIAGLHWSPRSAIYLAMDIVDPAAARLEAGATAAAIGLDRLDSLARLRREADVLGRPRRRSSVSRRVRPDRGRWRSLPRDGRRRRRAARNPRRRRHQCRTDCAERARSSPGGENWPRPLHTIHRHGYVYRDLKSSNVFVAPDGGLRLLDFDSAIELTSRDGFSRGTRGYASRATGRGRAPGCARRRL